MNTKFKWKCLIYDYVHHTRLNKRFQHDCKVGDIIKFHYNGGTRSDKSRVVRILSFQQNYNDFLHIKTFDFDVNENRTYNIGHIYCFGKCSSEQIQKLVRCQCTITDEEVVEFLREIDTEKNMELYFQQVRDRVNNGYSLEAAKLC